MRYGISCNILNITNQLFFAYQKLVFEPMVFISSSTKFTKTANFIHALKKKPEVWHKMMTILAMLQHYYNLGYKLLLFKPFFLN